jgi:phosphoenolpyruvate carboxykinase (ATP)
MGFKSEVKEVHYNLDRADLITKAIQDGEGKFTDSGALVVNTSPYTGRSPNDKYLIDNGDPDLWYASGTGVLSEEQFSNLQSKLIKKMNTQRLYVRDVFVGADPEHTARVRVITDLAWQNLAASNMFIKSKSSEPHIDPDFTYLVSSQFCANPNRWFAFTSHGCPEF